MLKSKSLTRNSPTLEQVLRRPDVWRGDSHSFVNENTIDTGYSQLNKALQHQGWPRGSLIEVCQHEHTGEWSLFHLAIEQLIKAQTNPGYIALLSPCTQPFIQGLQQLGIPYQQLIIVQVKSANEFVRSFNELCHSKICPIIFAWQQHYQLPYTQLRKLQLNSAGNEGLHVIFRPMSVIKHNSPASLRLCLQTLPNALQVHIFKQRGKLKHNKIQLPLPTGWPTLRLPEQNKIAQTTRQSKSLSTLNILHYPAQSHPNG